MNKHDSKLHVEIFCSKKMTEEKCKESKQLLPCMFASVLLMLKYGSDISFHISTESLYKV